MIAQHHKLSIEAPQVSIEAPQVSIISTEMPECCEVNSTLNLAERKMNLGGAQTGEKQALINIWRENGVMSPISKCSWRRANRGKTGTSKQVSMERKRCYVAD